MSNMHVVGRAYRNGQEINATNEQQRILDTVTERHYWDFDAGYPFELYLEGAFTLKQLKNFVDIFESNLPIKTAEGL